MGEQHEPPEPRLGIEVSHAQVSHSVGEKLFALLRIFV